MGGRPESARNNVTTLRIKSERGDEVVTVSLSFYSRKKGLYRGSVYIIFRMPKLRLFINYDLVSKKIHKQKFILHPNLFFRRIF